MCPVEIKRLFLLIFILIVLNLVILLFLFLLLSHFIQRIIQIVGVRKVHSLLQNHGQIDQNH